MERYLFTHDGYRCVDVDGSILHHSKNHEDLFDFVDKDEAPIYELLKEYLLSCVDVTTYTPRKSNNSEKLYHEMHNLISELHPFCIGEYLDREIANYFNDRFVQFCIEQGTNDVLEVPEQQYKALFDSLFPDGFGWDGNPEDDLDFQHMKYYISYRGKLNADEEYTQFDMPFSDISRAKLLIKDFLYWVLDSQAEPFGDLTRPQRLYLYNEYHHPETFKITNAKVEYYWGSEAGIRFDGSFMGIRHEIPLTVTLPDGRYMAEAMQGMATKESYSRIDPDAKNLLKKEMVNARKEIHQNKYCEVYCIESLFSLLFIECQRMYDAKTIIRRCDRCGHYFIANKQMYRYCERYIYEGSDQTCRDVGAKETAKKKISDNPVYYLYNKAYRTHHARISAGHITKREFDVWSAEAKHRMNDVMEDSSLLDEYMEWLKI